MNPLERKNSNKNNATLSYSTANFVVMKIHYSFRICWILDRIDKSSCEFRSIIDIIGTSSPFPFTFNILAFDFIITTALVKFTFGTGTCHTVNDTSGRDCMKKCFLSAIYPQRIESNKEVRKKKIIEKLIKDREKYKTH